MADSPLQVWATSGSTAVVDRHLNNVVAYIGSLQRAIKAHGLGKLLKKYGGKVESLPGHPAASRGHRCHPVDDLSAHFPCCVVLQCKRLCQSDVLHLPPPPAHNLTLGLLLLTGNAASKRVLVLPGRLVSTGGRARVQWGAGVGVSVHP